MIHDKEAILKAVAIGHIKQQVAELVWEMQLEQFNVAILDIAAEDIFDQVAKLEDPTDAMNSWWQQELQSACQKYLSHDSKPALSILPFMDKVNHALIASFAFGGMRHSVLHVVSTVAVVTNKIKTGATLSNIASPNSIEGSLPWFVVAKEIKKGAPEERILEKLNFALGYEVDAMNR